MNTIYKIRNVVNGKFYIGSTANTKTRFYNHRRHLRKGTHHCAHLQAAWNKYGEECFKFEVVEIHPDGVDLAAEETRWLDEHHGKEYCYNTGRTAEAPWRGVFGSAAPAFGSIKTEAAREQISQALKAFYAEHPEQHPRLGKKHTEEAKAKMAKKTVHRGEGHYRWGKTLDEATRKKIGDKQRGVKKAPRVLTEEGKAKIRAAAEAGHYSNWTGRRHTEESKAKMGRAVLEATTGTRYATLTEALSAYSLKMPTLRRALKTGKPIARGPCAGLRFEYAP